MTRREGGDEETVDEVDAGEVPAEQDGGQAVDGGRVTTSTDVELCEQLATHLRPASHGRPLNAAAIRTDHSQSCTTRTAFQVKPMKLILS